MLTDLKNEWDAYAKKAKELEEKNIDLSVRINKFI